jgi:predicted flap endonuclease-1-like 5' DNA nuclease
MPAARLGEMRRARADRAERLARLRGAAAPEAPEAEDPSAFLRVLRAATAKASSEPRPEAARPGDPAPAAAAVLPFQRAPERMPERLAERGPAPVAAATGDLDRLPGAGPGLVWALERAGIARLGDLAASAPAPLADRLGPIGGLIDLPAWIDFARTATRGAGGPDAAPG